MSRQEIDGVDVPGLTDELMQMDEQVLQKELLAAAKRKEPPQSPVRRHLCCDVPILGKFRELQHVRSDHLGTIRVLSAQEW